MKKQVWLWMVKIAAILLWAFMFFIPDIYERIENVQLVNHKEIEAESTSTFKLIEVEFSKDALYGHICFEFYTEDNEVEHSPVVFVEANHSKFAECEIEYENLSNCVRYEIKGVYVKTVNERIVDVISFMLAVVMFFVVLAVIRIDYEEKVVDGKTVGVYSGLIKHRVKIDGKKVFEEKWFTLFKGKEVLLEASENKDIKVMFSAMNKIDFEENDKPLKEEVKTAEEIKEEIKTEEKKTPKKKTTSIQKTGAKKVVSGTSKKAKFQVKSTSKKQGNKK